MDTLPDLLLIVRAITCFGCCGRAVLDLFRPTRYRCGLGVGVCFGTDTDVTEGVGVDAVIVEGVGEGADVEEGVRAGVGAGADAGAGAGSAAGDC